MVTAATLSQRRMFIRAFLPWLWCSFSLAVPLAGAIRAHHGSTTEPPLNGQERKASGHLGGRAAEECPGWQSRGRPRIRPAPATTAADVTAGPDWFSSPALLKPGLRLRRQVGDQVV